MPKNSKLVYSTDKGRIKEEKPSIPSNDGTNDGIVRLHRESKGRGGKGVTLIKGLKLSDDALKKYAKTLKKICGTGGTVKEGLIEIQGEQREKLKSVLEKDGYTVKIAGG